MNSVTPMGDVDRLATLIREQAAGESAEAVATAREQAERIRAAGQAEATSIRTAAEREGETRGRRRAAELLAVARAQQRMSLLQVRESLIDAALAQARAALTSLLTATSAGDMIAELIREGLPLFPSGPVRVRIAESVAARLDAPVRSALDAGRWTLRLEPTTLAGGGVILESEDGHLCFDNSLEARIRRRHNRLRQLAASILLLDAGSSGMP